MMGLFPGTRGARRLTRAGSMAIVDADDIAELLYVKTREAWEADLGRADPTMADADMAKAVERYENAIVGVFEELLEEHALRMTARDGSTWKIEPRTVGGWRLAAKKIMRTIEGVGLFDYGGDVQEFLRSGPWRPRDAVLQNLRHMQDFYRVHTSTTVRERVSVRL